MLKNCFRILLRWSVVFILLLFLLFVAIWGLLQFPAVQTKVVQQVTQSLGTKLQTKVSVEAVDIKFFKTVSLKQIYIEDLQKDTLLFAGELDVNIGLFSLLNKTISLENIELKGATVNLSRPVAKADYNFDFLIDAFASDAEKEPSQNSGSWLFDARNISLEDVRFNLDDQYNDINLIAKVGRLTSCIDDMNLGRQELNIGSLSLEDAAVQYYFGKKITAPDTAAIVAEPMAFPDIGWTITAADFQIRETAFLYQEKGILPTQKRVNFNDLGLKNIVVDANDFLWDSTTIAATIRQVALLDKSGFRLDQLKLAFLMDTAKTEVRNVLVKTNSSTIENNTGLRYKSFAAWDDFGNAVKLNTRFYNTKIALSDLKFFIPAMHQPNYPALEPGQHIFLDGRVNGNLRQLLVDNLDLNLGGKLILAMNGKVGNLAEPQNISFDVNLEKLETSYEKALQIMPDLNLPPGLKNFGDLALSGILRGTLADLQTEQLVLQTAANTGFQINGIIRGLPVPDSIFMELDIADLHTKAADLAGFSQNKLPPLLDSLGQVLYKGRFKGSLHKFDLAGILQTDIGVLDSDLTLDFDKDYAFAKYNGDLALKDFQLNKILGNNQKAGAVSLTIDAKGSGFQLEDINTEVAVEIEKLVYAGYTYKDIAVNGLLDKKQFTGDLHLHDPNANIDFKGAVNLTDTLPLYQCTLVVDTLNLKNIKLSDKDIGLSANTVLNFQGNSINDIDGRATLKNIQLTSDSLHFHADSLLLVADQSEMRNRSLSLQSDFLNGSIKGAYDFNEMKNLALAYINAYFPVEDMLDAGQPIPDFDELASEQNFSVDLLLTDPALVTLLVLPQLDTLENFHLRADFDAPQNHLFMDSKIEKISFAGITARAINMVTKGTIKQLENTLQIDDFKLGGNLAYPQINLDTRLANEKMFLQLLVAGDSLDQQIKLAGMMNRADDLFQFSFEDNFVLNNNAWTISPENLIAFSPSELVVKALVLNHKKQSISLNSETEKKYKNVPPLKITFDNFKIEEISDFANIENNLLEGRIGGTVTLIDFMDNLHYNVDLNIPDLALNKDTIGLLNIVAIQEADSDKIEIGVELDGNANQLKATGNYTVATRTYELGVDIATLEFRLLDPFLKGILRDSKGYLSGHFDLAGTPEQPKLTGSLNPHMFSTTVEFTKTNYALEEGEITFDNTSIKFGELTLTNNRNNTVNTAKLSGQIRHRVFSDMRLDLRFNTARFPFLNTTDADNPLFYGKVSLSANATIKGPAEQPVIEVVASTLPGSEFNLSPFSDTDVIPEENYIIFGNPDELEAGKSLVDNNQNTKAVYEIKNNIPADVRLNLELTDATIFRMIIDPLTGDQLECRGNSNLQIAITPSGVFEMFGNYIIKSGKYAFSYSEMVQRNFLIEEGGSVAFNGSPLNARFDITAKYKTKATPYELISSEATLDEQETEQARKRQTTEVLLNMRGELAAPQLSFDILLPEAEGSVISSTIQRKLQELRTNPNDLNKQVFGLLLVNSFIVSSNATDFASAGESVVLSSVSKLFSNQLNQLADKYVKGVQINFDLSSYKSDYADAGSGSTVTEVGVGITKQLFNDRLSLKAGGNFDLNTVEGTSGISQIAGDFVMEYKLSPNGNYLLKIFRKSDFDVLNADNTAKNGVGFSLRKSFGGKKKKKKTSKKVKVKR